MDEHIERFWGRVRRGAPEECWEWQAARVAGGYGHFYHLGKVVYAHRFLMEEIQGFQLGQGVVVRHECDNPPCCNPSHLRVGTQGDNMNDMAVRGRCTHGENHPNAKLSANDVRRIRQLHREGISGAELGRRFGVRGQTVGKIVRNIKRRFA